MDRTEAIALQRRNLDGFVRMLAMGADDSALFERDGVLAAIVPACPERSVINSVIYRDAEALGAAREELARAYEDAGVRAWTVWVPEDEADAAKLLEEAGHHLDASPLAMTLDLAGLPEPDGDELDWDNRATADDVARINDNAYGFESPEFGAAMTRLPGALPLRFYQARADGKPACVVGILDEDADSGVYLVATLKDHRGRGLARRLLHRALTESRERGQRTSTLQATKLGAPVYERLGYQTFGALEMWERRR
jgi:GNAT superfamily N-acetyltransferase